MDKHADGACPLWGVDVSGSVACCAARVAVALVLNMAGSGDSAGKAPVRRSGVIGKPGQLDSGEKLKDLFRDCDLVALNVLDDAGVSASGGGVAILIVTETEFVIGRVPGDIGRDPGKSESGELKQWRAARPEEDVRGAFPEAESATSNIEGPGEPTGEGVAVASGQTVRDSRNDK